MNQKLINTKVKMTFSDFNPLRHFERASVTLLKDQSFNRKNRLSPRISGAAWARWWLFAHGCVGRGLLTAPGWGWGRKGTQSSPRFIAEP